MDAFRLLVGSKAAGGFDLVLTSHAHKTPTLSSVFDSEGKRSQMGSKDFLRLSPSPNKNIKGNGSKLEHAKCGHVADPLLTCVSAVPEFGQSHKLLLDCMLNLLLTALLPLFNWRPVSKGMTLRGICFRY